MKIFANAKLNLSLAVTGKRPDGYHIIDSLMQSVNIRDELSVDLSDSLNVRCSVSSFDGEKNIAHTAAQTFFDFTGIKGGADIYIKKGIPHSAGLGGGSSDAAAVLTALNRLYNTKLSTSELCEIGLKVGADVPFCIIGGTARVGGIGEDVKPLNPVENLYFVIALNGTKSSTAAMYKQLDLIENPFVPDVSSAVCALQNGNNRELIKHIGNSFGSLTGLYGIDTLLNNSPFPPETVCLSGSGPAVFAVYNTSSAADRALMHLKTHNIECHKAVPLKTGVEI